MLRRYAQILVTILLVLDMALTFLAGVASYELRYLPLVQERIPITGTVPPFRHYVLLTLLALPLAAIAYRICGLYSPRRIGTRTREIFDVTRASALVVVALITLNFFLRGYEYSRLVLFLFFVLNLIFLGISRVLARGLLRTVRRRGWNLRYVLIVGAGRLGQKLAHHLAQNAWTGLKVVGFLDSRPERLGREYHGVPVLGGPEQVAELVDEHHVDQVFIALPFAHQDRLPRILDALGDRHTDIRLVPDYYAFQALNRSVEEFAGLGIINLRESPTYGWNRFAKRALDVLISLAFLVPLCWLWVGVALLIKLTSPGPAIYRQERMGLDGRLYQMLKFRTMRVDAEAETGAVWAQEEDPRRTWLGSLLRRTSLDEIPQFINVLRGEMSVVGPRPERPEFIEEFRRTVPRYMLRHKMKAGITGWAQINGWRGNTSLRKRIQYDLYYIQHWSLLFDLKIILLTPFRGMVSQHAY
jgi:Undecaprenyl-phosphate glucose phosphotransferase